MPFRESKLKILIVYSNTQILKEIKKFLKENNYQVYAARTSHFALTIQKKIQPEIIVTSLEPIGALKNEILLKVYTDVESPPILILLLHNKEEENLENILRDFPEEKIFETLLIDANIKNFLISTLNSAIKFYKEKNNLFQYLQEYEKPWKKQIEWLLWKEYHKTIFKAQISKSLIENIRISLLQGLGVNSLISYMDLIELKKIEHKDNQVIIPHSYLLNLKENIQKLFTWIKNLEKLIHYMNKTFPDETISCTKFQQLFSQILEEIEEFRKIKNQSIHCGTIHCSSSLHISSEALKIIIKEILINALKYSPENSPIDLIFFDGKKELLIGVINDILEFKGGITGIPEKYENQVFEPFVRLNHHYDERFMNEELSLGTGLSIVKLYLQYFDGIIYLKEIIDYTREPKKRILCGVTIRK